MKNYITKFLLLLLLTVSVTSCSVIEGIFKAGVGVGVFIVIAVLAIIIYIISKVVGKK